MISHDKKCIFVHIPKCAGSSINKDLNLKALGFSGHAPASYHLEFLGSYFSFSFVRNPYDRMVSAYKYFRKLKEGHRWYKRNKIVSDEARRMSFIEFVSHIKDFQKLMCRENGSFESGIHFQPFSYFLDEPIEYIGRVESIQEDYSNILSLLGFPVRSLRKINSTKNFNYRQLYSKESKMIVYSLYKEDIENYNYQF